MGEYMKLLIDGYNLVRSITHARAKKTDVQQILGRLRRYKRVTGHGITVVFDGGDGSYRYQVNFHGLTIWYSGVRETADDLIKDFLRASVSDEQVLVSDDRQLNDVAEERNIISVSPLFFLARLAERETVSPAIAPGRIATKTSEDENGELDALMYQTMVPRHHKSEPMPDELLILKGKKSSKLERRLEALIRKL